MRKINKILSGVTAATLAFGSMAAYVAYAADNVKAAYPSSGNYTNFNKLNYTAEKDGDTITVNFPTQTKKQVTDIQTELGAGNSNGTAPIYLKINVGSDSAKTGFNFLSGYGWDDGTADGSTHKEWNYDGTYMYLWLSATTESGYTVEYTLDKSNETKGQGTTLTFNFTYKEGDEEESGSGSSSSSSSSSSDDFSGESEEIEPGEAAEVETEIGTVVVETDAEDEDLAGATFVVEAVESGMAVNVLNSAVDGNSEFDAVVDEIADKAADGNAMIVDLYFEENGQVVEPGKPVTITLPIPSDFASTYDTIYVYHVGEDGVILIDECDVDLNGNITFTATKFSPFVFTTEKLENATVPKAEAPTEDPTKDPTEDPTTSEPTEDPGDGNTNNPGTGIALAVAPVVLAAGAFAVATFKRKH